MRFARESAWGTGIGTNCNPALFGQPSLSSYDFFPYSPCENINFSENSGLNFSICIIYQKEVNYICAKVLNSINLCPAQIPIIPVQQ